VKILRPYQLDLLHAIMALIAIVLTISVSSTHAEEAPDSYSLEAPAYYNKAIETCPTTVRGYDAACLK
jgi:hypothetical protein